MIYYPLSILMLSGIKEILVISMPEDIPLFKRLLSDGSQWGIHIWHAEQAEPRGLADALLVGREFIMGQQCALILGDNIFYGAGLPATLREAAGITEGATIFAYPVKDPERYGVVELDSDGKAISIEEKPKAPKSKYAIPGLYFYDEKAASYAGRLRPSSRGEIEISELNRIYMNAGKLRVSVLGRGVAWLDAGTHESLLQASSFIQTVEDRQGLMISCPEEIAFQMGYIDAQQLQALVKPMVANEYGAYLLNLIEPKR
jgi:glucose-1-phosphate thymidylyltransferase